MEFDSKDSYDAKIEALYKACSDMLQYIGTGYEAGGQSMENTMRQYTVRQFRKACHDLGIRVYDPMAARENE